MGTWERKKGGFLFSISNHGKPGAPVKSEGFEVTMTTLRHKMLSGQQQMIPWTRHIKLVVVCANQFELCCTIPKPVFDLRPSLAIPHACSFYPDSLKAGALLTCTTRYFY